MTTYGRGLRALTIATATVLSIGLSLVFFYAPLDADQGFIQKIFYIHVPLAIVTLCGFIAGGVLAAVYLRTGTASGTCAPTWPFTCRSSSGSACS